jgi:hypothetical protein
MGIKEPYDSDLKTHLVERGEKKRPIYGDKKETALSVATGALPTKKERCLIAVIGDEV